MSSNMSPTLILLLLQLLGVICARAAPTAEPELTTMETALEPEQRIDCKLTFDTTMDSLDRQEQLQLLAKGCQPSTNKPAEEASPLPQELRHGLSAGSSSSQPVYELQLVVWPDDDDEFSTAAAATPPPSRPSRPTRPRPTTRRPTRAPTTTTTRRTTTTTTTMAPTLPPLYEDQLVVFPQMDFQEENFDYFFDELDEAGGLDPSTTSSSPEIVSSQPSDVSPVRVLQNYHMRHPNGTEEHKLVLSNGLVNYIKLYLKHVDDRVINVQEGYNSVPTAGLHPQIETLYYIADERGYNVYRIEHSPMPPALPIRKRQQSNHNKRPQSKPSTV